MKGKLVLEVLLGLFFLKTLKAARVDSSSNVLRWSHLQGRALNAVDDEKMEKWLERGERTKRDLLGGALAAVMAGFQTLLATNPSLASLLNSGTAVVDQTLGFVQCCEPLMPPPPRILEEAYRCSIDEAVVFVNQLVNLSNIEDEVVMSKPTSQPCIFKDRNFNCSLSAPPLELTADGFPSIEMIEAALPRLFTSTQAPVIRQAARVCRTEMKYPELSTSGEIMESDKCNTVNSFLVCLQRVTTQECPDGKKKKGLACLSPVATGLLGVFSSAREIKDGVIKQVLNLVSSLLTA